MESDPFLPLKDVDWSDFLQTMKDRTPQVIENITQKMLAAHPRREAFQLFGVLTEDECKQLIEFTEKIGTSWILSLSPF